MSDEPQRTPLFRNSSLIGGLAFLGGLAVALGAVQLGGGFHRAPAVPVVPVAQPVVQPPAQPVAALPPGTDLATLNAREAMLAGKLDILDMRIRELDGSARHAASYATQAERLMIAFAVRRAVERGQPLGVLEHALRARFGEANSESVAAIVQVAAQPVTLEDLRLALETIAPRLGTGPDDSLWTSARRMLGDMVVIRASDSPSPRPSDRLRRARRAIDAGDVETALAEVAHMPGAASAESWTAAARRYVAARRALSEIERAAVAVPVAAGQTPVD
ncbi:hypothetical protein [Sphingomonas soli]|uniref:hypothetical protein n=1 Tax=Sphingomonas soli TaxID=266127 RepID=UPI000A565156|nr:hypothetical protein [Sphingomonas soli]